MNDSWQAGLQSPQREERLHALRTIQEQCLTTALPEVVEVLMRDPDDTLRQIAARIAQELSAQLVHPQDPYGQFRI